MTGTLCTLRSDTQWLAMLGQADLRANKEGSTCHGFNPTALGELLGGGLGPILVLFPKSHWGARKGRIWKLSQLLSAAWGVLLSYTLRSQA